MAGRYKDDSFHMLDTFGKTQKMITGFASTREAASLPLRGKAGNTWDAKHLTNFLNESNYSNWSEAGVTFYSDKSKNQYQHRRFSSSGDHFFKTTKDNKNVSKIGCTKINPLVSIGKTSPQHRDILKDYLRKESPERYSPAKLAMRAEGQYRFQGNSVKFQVTDPLTLQHM